MEVIVYLALRSLWIWLGGALILEKVFDLGLRLNWVLFESSQTLGCDRVSRWSDCVHVSVGDLVDKF